MTKFQILPEFQNCMRALTADQYNRLSIKIELEGAKPGSLTVANIPGDGTYLIDGHNTYGICQAKQLPIPAPIVMALPDRESAIEWIKDNQDSRRNLSPAELKEMRVKRLERVAEAVEQGLSTRAIADQEKVSRATIRQDIEDLKTPSETAKETSHVGGGAHVGKTPTPKVTGKDGKKYPAKSTAPKAVYLCPRCSRIGQPTCNACRDKDNPVPDPRHVTAPAIKITATIPQPDQHDEADVTPHRCPSCGHRWEGMNEPPLLPKKPGAKFVPPTLEEVSAYCQERAALGKPEVDPEQFLAHYQANGWVQGNKGKPVKDWKACVITFEKNAPNFASNGKPGKADHHGGIKDWLDKKTKGATRATS